MHTSFSLCFDYVIASIHPFHLTHLTSPTSIPLFSPPPRPPSSSPPSPNFPYLSFQVRPPQPPVYFFVIDVSAASAQNNMLTYLCEAVKASLDELPGLPRTQVIESTPTPTHPPMTPPFPLLSLPPIYPSSRA